jgi:hypothetical protein
MIYIYWYIAIGLFFSVCYLLLNIKALTDDNWRKELKKNYKGEYEEDLPHCTKELKIFACAVVLIWPYCLYIVLRG